MSAIPTTHSYVISNHGVYLGTLQNVLSPFQLNETINSAGAQLQINVGQSADIASQAISPIVDESGIPITDETGTFLLPERQLDIVGSSNANILIQNDNDVTVYEYSKDYPNGTCVFQGYISKWKANFGNSNDIQLTCLSYGQDLGQYVVEAGNGLLYHQDTDHGTLAGAYWGFAFAQAFTPDTNAVISGATLKLSNSSGSTNVMLFLYQGNPANDSIQVIGGNTQYNVAAGNTLVSQTTTQVVTALTPTAYGFSFPSNVTLTSGLEYYFVAYFVQGNSTNLVIETCLTADAVDSHFSGLYSKQLTVNNSGPFNLATDGTHKCLMIGITTLTGATTTTYTNDDTSFIMNDILTNYAIQGGRMQIPSAGYALSGQLTTYAFKIQTLLQAIQTIQSQLAPPNWWWYAEPSNSNLKFAKASTTADFVIVKGRHIEDLSVEATKENIKNVVYFTGGDDGTATSTNIFIKEVSSSSITANRRGLSVISDNRINSAAGGSTAAILIANNTINSNNAETYITTFTVDNSTIDTTLMLIGKTIGFAGFGNFVDSLVLQIVSRNRTPDYTTFTVGTLPPRSTQQIKDLQKFLAYLQTVNNPATASS